MESISIDKLPHGKYKVWKPESIGIHSFSQKDTKKLAAVRSAEQNTLTHLKENIFRPDRNLLPGSLGKGQNGRIVLIRPTGPYTESTLMGVALEDKIFTDPGELESYNTGEKEIKIVKSKVIYDLPPNLQIEYWKVVMATLTAYNKVFSEIDNKHVIAVVENVVPATSDDYRTSKSLRPSHFHVIAINTDFIEAQDPFIFPPHLQHLQEEIDHFIGKQKLMGEFTKRIHDKLPDSEKEKLEENGLKFVTTPPLGYEFSFKVSPEELLKDPKFVQECMLANHNIFAKIAKLARAVVEGVGKYGESKWDIIPQPAYRKYIYIKDGKLCMRICPVLKSSAGPMETLFLDYERDPKNKREFEDKKLSNLQNKILSITIGLLKGVS